MIYGNVYFQLYDMERSCPQWYKSERYSYCDSGKINKLYRLFSRKYR
ncbi:MAG: hypothetical protein SO178_06855 [Floccifex porci]|nr:hypothetical protein [Floccifex porci]MCI7802150.1 hypothetical protein [Erysipelotrichaceae bacterium]MDD7467781.1 hypothetical protein [Floccifex porci]MDY4797367.1 hypothetical protein [Floccifex porci]